MTISKKLFLMTALALNLGSQLSAYTDSQELNQHIFDFAITLSKEDDNNAKKVAHWFLPEKGFLLVVSLMKYH